MEKIIVTANIVVPTGPRFALNRTLDVAAYDKIDVTVPASATAEEVELQPGPAGRVQFIAIVSDSYSDDLSYTINAGTDDRTLDQPHLFMGKGAISMFDAAPAKLLFANASAQDAKVQILIGRKVAA
jgi:hypothetical protein